MPNRRKAYLSLTGLWSFWILKCFGGRKPEMPSLEALAYHAIANSIKTFGSARKVYRQTKRRIKDLIQQEVKRLHDSWSQTEGRLNYSAEEAFDLASRVLDEAWAKAFPVPGQDAAIYDGGMDKGAFARKFFGVRRDLAEGLIEAAMKEKKKIVAMVDDAIEQEIAAARLGVSLRQVLDFYCAVKVSSDFGLALIPLEPLNQFLASFKPEKFEDLMESYHSSGAMMGAYLKGLGEDEALKLFKRIFQTGIFKVASIDFAKENEVLKISCIAHGLSVETTRLLTAFLKGIIKGLGYKLTSSESTRGMITLKLLKVSPES